MPQVSRRRSQRLLIASSKFPSREVHELIQIVAQVRP
jgi:hypothetical protein